jgi:hypothetical protein
MKNKLRDYLENHRMTRLVFSQKIPVDPSMVYKWLSYTCIPSPKHAERIEEITQGEVPLTYWGYWKTEKGKIIRLARKPLEMSKQFVAAHAAYYLDEYKKQKAIKKAERDGYL